MSVSNELPPVTDVIDQVIDGLDLTPGTDPKYYRKGMILFKNNLPQGVYFEEFMASTTNAQNLESGVRRLIFRLKKKLNPFGYTIMRRTIYEIVPIEK